MRKTMTQMMVSLFFCVSLAGPVFCQEAAKDEKKKEPAVSSEAGEAQGELSAMTKRSISLITSRDIDTGLETEILLPLDKNVLIEHKRSLSELQMGDIVKVKYVVEVKDYGDRKKSETRAKVITFVSPAGQDSIYKKAYEKPAAGNTQMQNIAGGGTSEANTENELLPLKGEK